MTKNHIDQAIELIEKYPEKHQRGKPAPDYLIQLAEERLGIKFPPSYRDFLHKLGYGGYFADDYYGLKVDPLGGLENSNLISLVLDEREKGYFIKEIIPVCFDCMGGYYSIDTTRLDSSGENPIIVWVPGLSKSPCQCEKIADSFGKLFYDRMKQWATVE